jgi:hypothetical protein
LFLLLQVLPFHVPVVCSKLHSSPTLCGPPPERGRPDVAVHVTSPLEPPGVSRYLPAPSTVAQTSVVTPEPVSGCSEPRSTSACTPAEQSAAAK